MEAQELSAVFYHGLEQRSERTVYYFWRTGAQLATMPTVWDKELYLCVCVCGLSGGWKPRRERECLCVFVWCVVWRVTLLDMPAGSYADGVYMFCMCVEKLPNIIDWSWS